MLLNNAAVVWSEHRPVFLFKRKCEPAAEVLGSRGAFGPRWEANGLQFWWAPPQRPGLRVMVS